MTPRLSQLNKFLLRNTGLLPIDDIAEFLCVSSTEVASKIQDMGLPIFDVLPSNRAFPIICRRNHDLLSTESLARLLHMTTEKLVKSTQEMDFLSIKLGSKPDTILPIDFEERDAADTFRESCSGYITDYAEWDTPFSFLRVLQQKEERWATSAGVQCSRLDLRMLYSYAGSHGDFLLTGEDFYNDGILSRLQNRGINAGWMPGLLRDLAPSDVFEEFGKGHDIRLDNLRRQIEKAAEYGVKIYLYLNEPRFMPGSFFEKHPEARGLESHYPGSYGMCTSSDVVRHWLSESAKFLFSELPDLGGVIVISASEDRTNCASHLNILQGELCQHCEDRSVGEVLADATNIFADAAEAVGSKANIVQWVWGWDFVMPRDEVKTAISSLSPRVQVMVDWARYTPFEILGKQAEIIEYTLAYVKPSTYAKGVIDAARSQGRKVLARSSLVSTVEANALPYLPVMRNVQRLLSELSNAGVDGFLGCWIFGAYPGRNLEMLLHMHEESASKALATKYYGEGAEHALEAWRLFSDGMKFFPTTVDILYFSALNPGPGLRFSLEPEPWRFGMAAMATEMVEKISQPLGAEAMIWGFREVARYVNSGLESLERAVKESNRDGYLDENLKDYRICRAFQLHLLTVANYTEFVLVRDRWLADTDNHELKEHLVTILKDELTNAESMLDLAKKDSRIGYEGSIGYFYMPLEIIEKIYDIRCSIESLMKTTKALTHKQSLN